MSGVCIGPNLVCAIFANPTFLFGALSDSAILGKQVFLISPALEYRVASLRARVVALVGITGAVPTLGRNGGVDKLKSLVGPAGLEPATRPL